MLFCQFCDGHNMKQLKEMQVPDISYFENKYYKTYAPKQEEMMSLEEIGRKYDMQKMMQHYNMYESLNIELIKRAKIARNQGCSIKVCLTCGYQGCEHTDCDSHHSHDHDKTHEGTKGHAALHSMALTEKGANTLISANHPLFYDLKTKEVICYKCEVVLNDL